MTDSDVECVHRLDELAKLVQNGLVTMGEALARARNNRGLLTISAVPAIAEAVWNEARKNRDGGCLLAGLLDEWTRTHAADDPRTLYLSSDALVCAATEILIARDDGHLYRRAHQAADR